MDSYGDGNIYRGQVCKDPEIKTIEINRYNADVERLVEAAITMQGALKVLKRYYELFSGDDNEQINDALLDAEAALEPFNK